MSTLQRMGAVAAKELRQLSRDRVTFGMVVMIPLIQLLLFGFAINTMVRHIPVGVGAGLLVPAGIMWLISPGTEPSPGFHMFSGAALLCAFFIATDPVSAAASPRGRLIYGAGIGFLIYAIRTWGADVDGVAFAVLLMNMAVPAIDRVTRPRVVGHGRDSEAS